MITSVVKLMPVEVKVEGQRRRRVGSIWRFHSDDDLRRDVYVTYRHSKTLMNVHAAGVGLSQSVLKILQERSVPFVVVKYETVRGEFEWYIASRGHWDTTTLDFEDLGGDMQVFVPWNVVNQKRLEEFKPGINEVDIR